MAISRLIQPTSATQPTWVLLGSNSLTSATSAVTISSASFSSYKRLRVELNNGYGNASNCNYYSAINGDTSAYYTAMGYGVITSSGTYFYNFNYALNAGYFNMVDAGSFYTPGNGQFINSAIEISNPGDSNPKHLTVKTAFKNSNSYPWYLEGEILYNPPSPTPITSITVGVSTSTFAASSGGLRIYGTN